MTRTGTPWLVPDRSHRQQRTHEQRCQEHRRHAERGSVSLELAILGPALMMFVVLLIVGGRIALAGQAVQAAADEAARQASIARTQAQATATANTAAALSLSQQDLNCATTRIDVDTTGFAIAAGASAQVQATVTCVVDLADVAVPGVPGSHTMTATATSPIDTYRER